MVTGQNKQRVVIRWDDVTEVYERVIRGGSQMKHAEGWVYTVYHRGGRPVKLDNAIVRTRELGTAVQAAVHERMWPRALARYQAGETVRFGRQVGIGRQGLVLGPRTLPWERVAELRYSREGSLQVVLKERRRVWKTVPQAFIANYTTLQALVRQIDELKPSPTPPARQPAPARQSTFPAGSIGDVSVRTTMTCAICLWKAIRCKISRASWTAATRSRKCGSENPVGGATGGARGPANPHEPNQETTKRGNR